MTEPTLFTCPRQPGAKRQCRRCGGKMKPGIAMQSTLKAGVPDFPGSGVVTMSPGGPGRIIPVDKCERCGWSVS